MTRSGTGQTGGVFGEQAPSFEEIDDLISKAEAGGDPFALVEVGGLCYFDDRFDDARRLLEAAFAKLRAVGEDRLAARVAISLTDLHASMLGNVSAARGWSARARRVLETVGPGPEWGYLELAIIACARPDVDELLASADRALAIAVEFADTDLEVRALADSGLALVSQGRTSEGFARLDEALATICAGEIRQPAITGQAFCSMLSSCDRAQDVARAEEWIRLVDDLVLSRTGGRPPVLYTHCAGAYGSVLIDAGRWAEAEAALTDALGPRASACVGHRIDSTAALARLRVVQGRVDEAADLLATQEDRLPSCLPLAEVHLRRGDADLAAAVARRGVDELVGDASRRAPLLVLLVEALIAAGRFDDAAEAVRELEDLAERSGSGGFAAEVALCRGRVLAANGDAAAVSEFEAGIGALPVDSDRLIAGILRFELARALGEAGAGAAAIAQARAAHSIFERLAATGWLARAASLRRSLGDAPPPSAGDPAELLAAGLTDREREVLDLVCRGATNAQIGADLFISPKTVEHHVGRILSKLGARSRTEAAAMVAAATERHRSGP